MQGHQEQRPCTAWAMCHLGLCRATGQTQPCKNPLLIKQRQGCLVVSGSVLNNNLNHRLYIKQWYCPDEDTAKRDLSIVGGLWSPNVPHVAAPGMWHYAAWFSK